MKILVFDTETNQLLPKYDSSSTTPKKHFSEMTMQELDAWPYIVQFSYLVYDDVTHQVETYDDAIIRIPDHANLPEESIAIHKITREISQRKGIPLEEILDRFFHQVMTSADLIVGHNIAFDKIVVRIALARYKLSTRSTRATNARKELWQRAMNKIMANSYCTMNTSVQLCNIKKQTKDGRYFTKYPTLGELHFHLFQANADQLHNSLMDCLVLSLIHI